MFHSTIDNTKRSDTGHPQRPASRDSTHIVKARLGNLVLARIKQGVTKDAPRALSTVERELYQLHHLSACE